MSNIKKKNNKVVVKNTLGWSNVRTILFVLLVSVFFIVIIFQLAYIQFIKGKEYSQLAYNQQTKNEIISPNRGTIYDSKGKILAQSIQVDTISINPNLVTYSNGKNVENEVLAEGLSSIFDSVTYDELLSNLKSNKSYIVIAKKVENEKVEELKSWMSEKDITSGINIDEDYKRYYPKGSLASNLIGFCGSDNTGLTGIEERWNNVLTGTAGKVVTATDVNGKAISDEDEEYVASENGSNIYLTIDSSIQSIAEKYLEQAMMENPTAKSGNITIMNPQNGEILAMASNPDFDLNEPYSYTNLGYSEEEWNALESTEKSIELQNLWKNSVVSGTYEPGSTFKLITASVGLEEGIVQTDTAGDFYCAGSYNVADETISCWASNPHGSQSLREALEHSCNPAFMQLGQRIGAKTLYRYFNAFGLFDVVGNDIAKAYKGQFTELESIGPVELATTSFGQRFEISPLQLITAVSAICNDGVLVKPKIVKKIENTDTKSIEVVDTQEIRQVISKDTADKVKNMMQSVVTDGTGWRAAVEGYSIGGKSGTSEPRTNHESEGYVASFIAISPIENTQIVVLITLSGLQEWTYHQGGETCGPVASQILSEVLPLIGVTSSNQTEEEVKVQESENKAISLPNVKGKTLSEAYSELQALGFNVKYDSSINADQTIVQDQMPKYGSTLYKDSIVCLYTENEAQRNMVTVPNVKGMTSEQAKNALQSKNLNIQIDGTSGIVVSQDPTYETEVEEGTIVTVTIKEQIVGNQ